MALIVECGLDMVKMCNHARNKASVSRHLKVTAQTDRRTHRHTDTQTDTPTVEFLGNSLTQTNQINQTKQKFIRLYYLDCWIRKIQSDEQNKSST